jgi:hypothetical protein
MCENEKDDVIDVPVEKGMALQVPGGHDIIEIAKRAQQTAEAYKLIRKHALSITYETDWMIHGQKDTDDPVLYLEGKGARRLAHAFGIEWMNIRQEKVVERDSEGEYYTIITYGEVKFQGRVNEEMGAISSKDQFFSRGTKIPSEDVDPNMIRKKSYTDFCRRAVTNMLGLEQVPLSELQGKNSDKIQKQDYAKGSKGGNTQSTDEKDKAKKIGSMLLEVYQGDKNAAADELERLTEFKGRDGDMVKGLRKCEYLKGKRLEVTYEKVCEWYEKQTGDQ